MLEGQVERITVQKGKTDVQRQQALDYESDFIINLFSRVLDKQES